MVEKDKNNAPGLSRPVTGSTQATSRLATSAGGIRPATDKSAASATANPRLAIMDALKKIDTGVREFEYSNHDFERVRALIYKRAGISLSPVKQDMVYSRLARRLRAKGLKRFVDYLDQLEKGNDAAEWEAFVNALTTNLTSFFREAHHFDLLAEQMRKNADRRPFKIWCCAASTGEEPYSLAITACEVFGNNPPVQILASDLDTNVLAHGQKGVYTQDRVDRLDAERVQRFFLRGTGVQDGHIKVRPELQRLITFKQVNLLDATWALRETFDAIFCRNVMIYFDKQTQYAILERFVSMLQPQGLLYAGHSENFIHAANLFKSLGKTVYARADAYARR
ncbi:CheR family methyltransferase [Uliginosibacterium gangwonense]|uniref:CheR family methyltransferase n=1 Tax=Uliginosibacterium gangwonense TaxID=392736 RepID=UPI00037F3A05